MQSGIFCADIGTSSLKAAFITEDGTVLKFIRLLFPQPVQAVDWVQAFFAAWHTLPAEYVIEAICVSGNGPSLVAVPQNRRMPEASINSPGRVPKIHINAATPLSAASLSSAVPPDDVINGIIDAAKNDTLFLWNEPVPQGLTVSGQQGAIVPAPQEGTTSIPPAGASLFLPRIAAFRAKYPDVFDSAAQLFSGPEYVSYLLTGAAVTSLPDPRYEAAYWSKEELFRFSEALHIDTERLAGLLPPFTAAGTVIGRFCGIPVVAGVPDFIAALIGTGTLTAGTACDRAGSSEGINVCILQPCRTEKTLLLPSVMPDLWNLSSVIPSSGAAFSSFLVSHGFLGNDYIAAMERIAEEPLVAFGAYPATFAGQGRAFVEALAFRIRHGCDLLEQASGFHPVYTLSGGQAHNAIWCQMKADMTGRTFALPAFADGELIGDAALALYGLGRGDNLASIAQRLIRIKRYYEPEPAAAQLYTEKYSRC
ncbi:carbohydrate kinase [Treponema sp. OMZ 857]|nr:carbohydrate kinase [Treponema sp. OMZ 857]